uniref:WXG100 family type VII secretion target n=1 Tax=uncultured Flavonifractor sp. TaxID=1193534 RepID=UPI002621D8C1|nr:WXG100 family type VII secretion target [uncultured Flavonifractor sp.]
MDGIIKVSTEQLRSTSSEFSTLGQRVSSLTSEMTNLITGLSSDYEGEAAQAYINKFRGLDDDIQKINRMIQEHVTDLNDMAQRYDEAENKSVSDAGTLSSDVIV